MFYSITDQFLSLQSNRSLEFITEYIVPVHLLKN